MAKEKTGQRKLSRKPARRRWEIAIVATVAISVLAGWAILAYSGAIHTAVNTSNKELTQTVVPASTTSFATPSKEYIYAGGKLIATEEPSSGGSGGQGRAVFDFEPDHKTEIAFYRNGLWGVLKSSQSYGFGSAQFFSWGGAGLTPVNGDFDGDSKEDLAYMAPTGGSSQAYAILKSGSNYDFGRALFVPAGFADLGDRPVVGDFDGDRKADPAIWRGSNGNWIIPTSSSGYAGYIFSQWGQQ